MKIKKLLYNHLLEKRYHAYVYGNIWIGQVINPLKSFRLYLRNGTVQTCLYILLTSTKRKYSIYITPYCISVDLEGRFDRHETVKHISSMLQVFGVNFLQKWYRNLLYWKKNQLFWHHTIYSGLYRKAIQRCCKLTTDNINTFVFNVEKWSPS